MSENTMMTANEIRDSYKEFFDLNQKLEQWENFYNFNRPHGSFKGKTPYEILKLKLK